jgi:hypothetical protein
MCKIARWYKHPHKYGIYRLIDENFVDMDSNVSYLGQRLAIYQTRFARFASFKFRRTAAFNSRYHVAAGNSRPQNFFAL